MRGQTLHLRDATRHLLALALMAGTLAGTVWTFSAGRLSIAGVGERLISVGGIAAALECGLIYTGWYIGQLDLRIQTARRREAVAELRGLQRSLYRWFYAVALISATANLLFRIQQLGSWPLAAFVSGSPIILVILFTIKLRPLPTDYAEIGRQATQRGLVAIVEESQAVMLQLLRRMGRGHTLEPSEIQQLAMASALVRVYALPAEQQALDHAIAQHAGEPRQIEASAERWLSTSDLVRDYGVSARTAQDWAQATPGRRKRRGGNAWELPASAIYAAHGLPPAQQADGFEPGTVRTRVRKRPQNAAMQALADAMHAPSAEVQPQLDAARAQAYDDEDDAAAGASLDALPVADELLSQSASL